MQCDPEPLEPILHALRRHKDPDELAILQRLITISNAGYAAARSHMQPGRDELEIYEAIHAAMVYEAGSEIADVGWDFACGQMGGPPRQGRRIERGELNIFDLGPHHWGYFMDSCRTFAVGGSPTSQQQEAFAFVEQALTLVERLVKPGVRTKDVWRRVVRHLSECKLGEFTHHLGHGVGLEVHESPRLNPDFDDVFVEGDVFAAEPGLYSPALLGGLRLEQLYQVTADGIRMLTNFPLQMHAGGE